MQPHPHRHPGITFAAIAAEIARELEIRAPFYQRQVDRGRMTRREASFGLDVAAAWAQDCERLRVAMAPNAQGRPALPPAPPAHGLRWRDRVAGLQRELAHRAEIYPREIERRRLTAADAAHRTSCLEALLTFYDDGLDWPDEPDRRAALFAEIQARRHPATQQQELLLA